MSSNTKDWNRLLVNKVVFLTGAAGGVARYIARACYTHGARLVLGDSNLDGLNQVKEEILEKQSRNEDRLLIVKLDVSDEKSIEQAVQATVEKWQTIDVLFNTAAVYVLGMVDEVSAEDWTRIFNVNVRGYALMAKHVVPFMKKQNSGSIVNMASTAASMAAPAWVPYAATKGAIAQLTRNLALDLGPFNIRVNSVSPSAIDTPVTFQIAQSATGLSKEQLKEELKGKCLKKICPPEEVAHLFVFLASDLCSFITGANLPVDGGSTIA